MGYINYDSNIITVDAILTKKGREILASGKSLNISKFALADDEIDYSLWNTAHPSGSDYYGFAIESLPLIEAVPDETKLMKYKLVTLEQGNTVVAVIQVPNSTISFNNVTVGAATAAIRPSTLNGTNDLLGYQFVINNPEHFQTIRITQPVQGAVSPNNLPRTNVVDGYVYDGRSYKGQSLTLIGKEIEFTPISGVGAAAYYRGLVGNQNLMSLTSIISVSGREIGGTVPVTVTINLTAASDSTTA